MHTVHVCLVLFRSGIFLLISHAPAPSHKKFWRRRQDLNLRIPPGAVLCLLSYVCECSLRDTSLRGARGPVPNRNCTGASRASTSCRRRAAFAGRSLYIHGALAETHHPKTFPAMVQTVGLAPASSQWHHQGAALLVELRLHIGAGGLCVPTGQQERN